MRSILVLLAVLLALGAKPVRAQQAIDPLAGLPPERAWSGPSEALQLGTDHPWATPAERTGLLDSPSYDETVLWLRRLVDAAPQLTLLSLGSSPQGRPIWMVMATKEGAQSAEELRANGRPTVLVQAGIHSGEIDGKDAGMMLLRDMTVRELRADLLEGANLLFVPILSVDAHERASAHHRINQRGPARMGWRTNARNLNLNRDYSKLDTPELRALVEALNAFDPDLYIDVHVTDGADYQADITYGWNTPASWSPAITAWMDARLRSAIDADLLTMGHVPDRLLFLLDERDPEQGLWGWTAPPRFSNGYGDARHLPTLLVENHSLKPFRRRVLGTYVLLESALRAVAEDATGLREAIAADRARRQDPLPLGWTSPPEEDMPRVRHRGMGSELVESPISGDREIRWNGEAYEREILLRTTDVADRFTARPVAYLIPAEWSDLAERLRWHGIRMERLEEEREEEVEVLRLTDFELGDEPYEGHVQVTPGEIVVERTTRRFAPGSWRVPTDQPLGDLAMLLLEPASEDSYFQWGFLLEILQRTEYFERYAMEPVARAMLEADPSLGEAFERALEEDPELAADPRARLYWFYERSPWFDREWKLYPIARVPRGG